MVCSKCRQFGVGLVNILQFTPCNPSSNSVCIAQRTFAILPYMISRQRFLCQWFVFERLVASQISHQVFCVASRSTAFSRFCHSVPDRLTQLEPLFRHKPHFICAPILQTVKYLLVGLLIGIRPRKKLIAALNHATTMKENGEAASLPQTYEADKRRKKLPHESDSTFFFTGSVLVSTFVSSQCLLKSKFFCSSGIAGRQSKSVSGWKGMMPRIAPINPRRLNNIAIQLIDVHPFSLSKLLLSTQATIVLERV